MKKVKILVASVLFCAMGYIGYTAYEKMTMSDVEKFMQANVEALTVDEQPDPNKWVKLDLPCFGTNGIATGKHRRSCSHPGFEPSCFPHGCE